MIDVALSFLKALLEPTFCQSHFSTASRVYYCNLRSSNNMLSTAEHAVELVLPFLEDPKDLLACSLASTHHQPLIKLHVQLHLQQLLAQSHSAISRGRQSLCPWELQWLCSTGSDIINTAPVMQQLVKLLATAQPGTTRLQQAVSALVKAGLCLTKDLILEFARQHHPHMTEVIRQLYQLCKDDKQQCGPFGLVYPLVIAATHPLQDEGNLSLLETMSISSNEELYDMWRVACNQRQSAALMSMWRAQQTSLFASSADKQRRSELRGLVCELMQTCEVRQHEDVMQHLATLQVAQELGAQAILPLMHKALMHACTRYSHTEFSPNCLEPLVQLPGAQAISTDAVAHAMQLSFDLRVPYMCEPLLELQNATKIPSAQLCRLISSAMQAELPGLTVEISIRLTVGRQLDTDDVVSLVLESLRLHALLPQPCAEEEWVRCLADELELHRHFDEANIMTLLLQVAADRGLQEFLPHLDHFVPLGFDADKQVVLPAVKTLLQAGSYKACRALLQLLPQPPEEQLQLSECFELVANCLEVSGELLPVPDDWNLWAILRRLGWAEVQHLLRLAAAKSAVGVIAGLARVPAAAQVEVPLLLELLQVAITSTYDSRHWIEPLLALPAAQQLCPAQIQQLLDATLSAGRADQAMCLLEWQPTGAEGRIDLSSSQIKQLLMTVCRDRVSDNALVLRLLQHPGAAGLTAVDAAAVAVAHMHAKISDDWDSMAASEVAELLGPLQRLQQLPAMQQLQCPDTLLQIMTGCLANFGSKGLQQWAALPAARHLTGEHLQKLLTSSFRATQGVRRKAGLVLSRLPACQQLSAGAVEELLLSCLHCLCDYCNDECVQSVEFLLQLPAAQHLPVQSTAKVADEAVRLEVFGVLQPLLQLPVAQQLTVQQVKPWVKEGLLHRSRVVYDAVRDLPCVVSGAAADIELRLGLDALQARA